jgi:hypothetical protein
LADEPNCGARTPSPLRRGIQFAGRAERTDRDLAANGDQDLENTEDAFADL